MFWGNILGLYLLLYTKCILSNNSDSGFIKYTNSLLNPQNHTQIFDLTIQKFIKELLSISLSGEYFFVIHDINLYNKYDWLEGYLVNNLRNSTYVSSTLQGFDPEDYEFGMVRGSQFTVLIFVYSADELTNFFGTLGKNNQWGALKLIIVMLNYMENFKESLFKSSIQRSKYIFIVKVSMKNNLPVIKLYTLYLYEQMHKGKLTWKIFLGNWNGPRNKNEIFTDRLSDFGGKKFETSSICVDFPLMYELENGTCVGANLDTFQIIADKLNFKYGIQARTADGDWQGNENGTWTGMLGEILYDDKDLIINYLVILEGMENYFDFTFPYSFEGMGFMAMIPPPLPSWSKIFLPFTTRIWIFFFITFLAIIPLLYLLVKYNGTEYKYNFSTIALIVTGVIFRQYNSVIRVPRFWFTIFITMWLIVSFIITSAYMGLMISFLSIPRFPRRMETIEELAFANMKVGMVNYGGIFTDYLQSSSNKAMKTLGYKMDVYPNNYIYDTVVGLMKSNYHVMFDGAPLLIYLRHQYNLTDSAYFFKDQVFRSFISFVFPKHSQLLSPINNVLVKLIETGIYEHIYKTHTEKILGKGSSKTKGSAESLKLDVLQAPFYFLVGGYLIGSVVLFAEIQINKKFPKFREEPII